MTLQLQSTFYFGEAPVKVTPFQLFLFVLALEILYDQKLRLKDWQSDHCYLYSAYTDYTTFFLTGYCFCKTYVDTFLPYFSGLKEKLTKSEIEGIGVLKGVEVVVCDMRCIDPTYGPLKILGTHFSYNENIKEEKIYNNVTDI